MFGISSLLTLALATFTIASPSLVDSDRRSFEVRNGVNHTLFEHRATGSNLSFVTNSGVCETTPGVNQYSGYFSVGTNMSMFFWLFESRNNPSTAPLALWLTGGPGCSSMVGLFQENGPCTFNNVSGMDPVLNPYSWNNFANMLYVDQPVGVGFSYGTESTATTLEAAEVMWIFFQAFYACFPDYQNHDFGLFTESYGGHYGPMFVSYFESQNTGIVQGTVQGEEIRIVALAVNSGWIDPDYQFKALIDFSVTNPYRPLINNTQATALYNSYYENCLPALNNCTSSDSNEACSNAAITCLTDINDQFEDVDFDIYDIRQGSDMAFPPVTYVNYLQDSKIQARIGAQVQFQNCSISVFNNFVNTGDYARSFLDDLSEVVKSGIQVVVWVGEADWICNSIGLQEVVSNIQFDQSDEFNAAPLVPYTVNGKQYGTFKKAGKFSFLMVEDAGHEVPAFQPVLAQQVFRQTINQETLYST